MVQAYVGFLRDENSAVRMIAARDLSKFGVKAKPALELLVEALQEDTDATVRIYAAIAVGAIGPEAREAVAPLAEVLENDNDPNVRAYAADALGDIGSQLAPPGPEAQAAAAALTKALADESRFVRQHATKALQKLTLKESQQGNAP
jgi:HEAT repeat protein